MKKLAHEWEMASNSFLLSSQSLHPLTCSVAVQGLFLSGHALINFYDSTLSCCFYSNHELSVFFFAHLFFSYYKCDIIYGYKFLKSLPFFWQFPQWFWLTPKMASTPHHHSFRLTYNLPYHPTVILQTGSWYKSKHSSFLVSNDKVCSVTSLVSKLLWVQGTKTACLLQVKGKVSSVLLGYSKVDWWPTTEWRKGPEHLKESSVISPLATAHASPGHSLFFLRGWVGHRRT